MAADDPLEKSLFARIRDCVLIELKRSKNEVKRAQCPSKSAWGWNADKNGSVVDNEDQRRNGDGNDKKENEKVSREEKLGQSQESGEKKFGLQTERRLDGKGHDKSHFEAIDEKDKKHERSRSNVYSEENEKNQIEKQKLMIQQENEKKRIESEKHESMIQHENEKTKIESEKHKSMIQQESCDSQKFKPVRYYIKMQNPEAPVCCKPRKICPPKIRKSKQQEYDSYRSRPNCQCDGCSSQFA